MSTSPRSELRNVEAAMTALEIALDKIPAGYGLQVQAIGLAMWQINQQNNLPAAIETLNQVASGAIADHGQPVPSYVQEEVDRAIAHLRSELRMLVLSRRPNESIVVGNNIEVFVKEIKGDAVQLGIKAPANVPVNRQEVHDAINNPALQELAAQIIVTSEDDPNFETVSRQLLRAEPDVVVALLNPLIKSAEAGNDFILSAKLKKIRQMAKPQRQEGSGQRRKRRGHRSELRVAQDLLQGVKSPQLANVGDAARLRSMVTSKSREALIFDREFALAEGGLAFIQSIFGKSPAVVLIESEKDTAFIEAFNQQTGTKIAYAYSVEEARTLLKDQIRDQIALLGGVKADAFGYRALVSMHADQAQLKRALGDIPLTVITPQIADGWAQSAGLASIIEKLRASYATLTAA